jgi:hypothetical protein
MKQKLINGILMAGFIATMAMIAYCGWNTGDEMAVKNAKTSIPSEEASWTESRSYGKGEWHKNFEVIE